MMAVGDVVKAGGVVVVRRKVSLAVASSLLFQWPVPVLIKHAIGAEKAGASVVRGCYARGALHTSTIIRCGGVQ